MKASLEEGARFQGDLEGDLLMGFREGSVKEGWAFKAGGDLEEGISEKGSLGQRKTPGMVQLGCKML